MSAQHLSPHIIGLDKINRTPAIEIIKATHQRIGLFKIHALWDRAGWSVVGELKEAGALGVFVDLKLCDTKETVEDRAGAVKDAGGDILTVHAGGGVTMMKAAIACGPPNIWAITLLTSIEREECMRIYGREPAEVVLRFAEMAQEAGVHGLVCSALEVEMLKQKGFGEKMELVVPGTRSAHPLVNTGATGQKRGTTPAEAMKLGAKRLVFASQVTRADDPARALDAILSELE